jgi:hypothetical protein
LNLRSIANDGTEVGVACASLGPRVHLLSVLLIDESDGDELGTREEARIGVRDDCVVGRSENETIEVDALCLACDVWLGILARTHGKKEGGSNDDVGQDRGGCIADGRMVGCLEEFPKQARCDGLLTASRRVYVFECFEEGFDDWLQVLAARDVKGTRLEIVPKRRSQTACGRAESARDQWLRMSSFQSACDTPLSSSIEAKEGANVSPVRVILVRSS